eukprot:TRINITY_DN8125_c0_g2_i1.p1 TRINITY_DN8125_c0_g2~~TRINITY_DN8125_c0_g2_i1.p1  ORF type:complete len:340 (-),score=31.93 TRINITY_DN8125_c0_g2_i1:164-1078(-)
MCSVATGGFMNTCEPATPWEGQSCSMWTSVEDEEQSSEWAAVSLAIKPRHGTSEGKASKLTTSAFTSAEEGDAVEQEAQRASDKAQDLRQQGNLRAAEGDLPAALRLFDQAVFYDPVQAAAHEMRAQVLLELGRTWDALQAAQTACNLESEWPIAWQTLARSQANFGEMQLAVSSMQHALSLDASLTGASELQLWKDLVAQQESADAIRVHVVSGDPGQDALYQRCFVAQGLSRFAILKPSEQARNMAHSVRRGADCELLLAKICPTPRRGSRNLAYVCLCFAMSQHRPCYGHSSQPALIHRQG